MRTEAAAVGSIVIDVLLGFPAVAAPWWRDGAIAPALFDELGAWSTGWAARGTYRIGRSDDAPTYLHLHPAQGLRLYYKISAAAVAARATMLLDDVVAWLGAVRRSDIAGGVRIRRAGVIPDADYPSPGPSLEARAWDLGTVLDAIEREAYAGEVAAQYFAERYARLDEGDAELARLLAAPAPPGSVRVDDGPLVMWKHVADLSDAAAVERARVAQHAWITNLVEVAPA